MRSSILVALKAKLVGITGIKSVYDYEVGKIENYPVALILGSSNESERESVKSIRKTYIFKVRILQETNKEAMGREQAESNLNEIFDTIENALDNDDTLGGACHDVNINSVFSWEDRELMMRAIDIDIACFELRQLT